MQQQQQLRCVPSLPSSMHRTKEFVRLYGCLHVSITVTKPAKACRTSIELYVRRSSGAEYLNNSYTTTLRCSYCNWPMADTTGKGAPNLLNFRVQSKQEAGQRLSGQPLLSDERRRCVCDACVGRSRWRMLLSVGFEKFFEFRFVDVPQLVVRGLRDLQSAG